MKLKFIKQILTALVFSFQALLRQQKTDAANQNDHLLQIKEEI